MNPVRKWWRVIRGVDDPPVSPEAATAVEESRQRADEAQRQADDMAERVAPIRAALDRDRFDEAIRASYRYIGRHA